MKKWIAAGAGTFGLVIVVLALALYFTLGASDVPNVEPSTKPNIAAMPDMDATRVRTSLFLRKDTDPTVSNGLNVVAFTPLDHLTPRASTRVTWFVEGMSFDRAEGQTVPHLTLIAYNGKSVASDDEPRRMEETRARLAGSLHLRRHYLDPQHVLVWAAVQPDRRTGQPVVVVGQGRT